MDAPNAWTGSGLTLYVILGLVLLIVFFVYGPCFLTGDYCPQ